VSARRGSSPADYFRFLLSTVFADSPLHPAHLADLAKSGLTDQTIRVQRVTDVPPDAFSGLLGFDMPRIASAYLLPFADPRGGWMPHVRMRVFPPLKTEKGTIKYLQPRRSGVRIYFPLATLDAVLHSDQPLYVVEGEKKSLAVAQTGLPAVGICGIEGWHVAGSKDLHPDLDDVGIAGRRIYLIPDADVRTKPAVARAVRGLAAALSARGTASVELVRVPAGFKGIDDWLAAENSA
jgi:hypothetical protein